MRIESIEHNPAMQSVEIFSVFSIELLSMAAFGMMDEASEKLTAMPQWTLNCSHCNRIFSHSKIEPQLDTLLYDSLWPYRPEVPEGGFGAICPHCREAGLYQRFQLTLRPADTLYLV
jgi:hypothetical protein